MESRGAHAAKFFVVGAFVAAIFAFVALSGLGATFSPDGPWTAIGIASAAAGALFGLGALAAAMGFAVPMLELAGGIGSCLIGAAVVVADIVRIVGETAPERRHPMPIAIMLGAGSLAYGAGLIRASRRPVPPGGA